MSRIRTIFLGTPEFARHCLESLIKDEHFEVVGVVTQPDRPSGRDLKLTPSPVKQLVQPLGIACLSPEKICTPENLAEMATWKAEVVVVVAYGQILTQAFLDLFPRRVVNVHASLLPQWRGAAPIQRAIMAGDKETGVCLQVMVKKLDAGDVLGSRRIAITDDLDAPLMHDRMTVLASELLSVDLMDYLRGNLTPVPQDEALVTYAPKIDKSESVLDWKRSARQIFNQIRGMALGPGVYTRFAGKKVKIHRARPVPLVKSAAPGAVVAVDADSFVVACGEQALEIIEVQPESRARMKVSDYLKGYPLALNDRFE